MPSPPEGVEPLAPVGDDEGDDDDEPAAPPPPTLKTSLKFCHALGFVGGCPPEFSQGKKLVDHTSDDSIVYLAGKHVAVYAYDHHKAHRFILKNPRTARVVAFCVSANRRYIALSEVLLPEPNGGIQVSVYNFSTASKVRELGRSRFPSNSEGAQPPVVALDFSRDNKYLVTVTDPPNPYLYLWQLDKQRLAGMAELYHKVSQVTISPWEHWELCTSGTSLLNMWRAQGNQLKSHDPMSPVKPGSGKHYRFTCHAWFDCGRIVAGTAEGDVLVIENQEMKLAIPEVHGPGRGVSCIYAVSRGFLTGGDAGMLSLFERTFDSQFFSCFKTFQTPEFVVGSDPKVRVTDVTISPNEENVVCCYDNNQMVHLNLNNVEHLGDPVADAKDKHNVYRLLPIGFHNEHVTGVSVCVQKSILATASTDKHIRMWNFVKKRVELDKKFDEDVLSLALHPAGYLLVAGFRYKLCVFIVLSNDLYMLHEFPNIKQCREVQFSHGGQYFAAVANPWSRILVVNTYSLQPLGARENPNGIPLTGHSASVQSLCWTSNDQSLISAGSEGAIYEWKVACGKRNETNESVMKTLSYQCIRYDDNSQMLAALGVQKAADDTGGGGGDSEVTLRTFPFQSEYPPRAPQRTLTNPIVVPHLPSGSDASKTLRQARGSVHTGQLAVSPLAQTLFLGTSSGQVLLFHWPPTDVNRPPPQPYSQMDVHQGEVSFVLLSHDERYLFTIGGEDKCLFMFDVDVISEGRQITRKPFPYSSFESLAYISQNDFDERARLIAELNGMREDLVLRHQSEKSGTERRGDEELRQAVKEGELEVAEMKRKLEEAVSRAEEADHEVKVKDVHLTDVHLKTAEELEALHTKRIAELEARQTTLQDEKDDLITRYENKVHKLTAEIQVEKRLLEQEQRELDQRLSGDVDVLRSELEEARRRVDETVNLTIHDYILELDGGAGVEGLHEKWKEILRARDAQCSQTRTNTALFRTRREKHQKEIDELQAQIEVRKEQERQLSQKAQEHVKTNEALKAEISQRNDTISASEKKILELKKQTAELEKLRYVLTYKFSELRKEVAPKEEKIRDINDAIQEMDMELEKTGIKRDGLIDELAGKDGKVQGLMQTLHRQNRIQEDTRRQTELLLRELASLVAEPELCSIQDRLQAIVSEFSVKHEAEVVGVYEKEKAEEFSRQKSYMQQQVCEQVQASRRTERALRLDSQIRTEENGELVKEINALRQEKRLLSQRWQQAESQLKELQAGLLRQKQQQQQPAEPHTRPFSAPASSKPRARIEKAVKLSRSQGTAARGRLVKGSTRSFKELSELNPQKLAEIVVQVEQTNSCIKQQGEEILRLKDYVRSLLQNTEIAAGASDGGGGAPSSLPVVGQGSVTSSSLSP